ncbi:TKL family protein kinase [Trichomonas vaginalis G3]|uniref:TKL family protein kinase n=1 Tax=Trichomonas vaginalis (strain ATCC PRA-98 / G3) TaxID=412133 RepID=A2D7Y1_TRIV3|nr:protein ubiquitination [Trichomonas vaginalis G3]EAY23414.1 TKL family protein kinase [Trichomonas vaginalis G3]KAI5493827.1 protein ubiquitination [Trichomonas vaginalis G3]|eukprot:XP_001584400.1 TKL family protein kinase [Trichomonas vaginalis G3]
MSFAGPRKLLPDDFEHVKRLSLSELRMIDVLKEKSTNNEFIAITHTKFGIKDSRKKSFFERVNAMACLHHPAVCTLYGYFLPDNAEKKCPTLLFKNAKRGCLGYYIDKSRLRSTKSYLEPPKILKILLGVASALKYLHSQGFVCGDLQPTSIFLNENYEPLLYPILSTHNAYRKLNVATFDMATDLISPPELLSGNFKKITPESDIYAFGILTFRFICKKIVFNQVDVSLSFSQNIIQGKRFMIPQFSYTFLREIVENCWVQDPNKRPSMADVYKKLKQDCPIFLPEHITEPYLKYVESLDASVIQNQSDNSFDSQNSDKNSIFLTGYSSDVFDINQLKESAPYKYIKNHPELSQNKILKFKFILKLQNHIIETNPTNFEDNIKWISRNVDFDSPKGIDIFIRTLCLAALVRWRDITTYANMFKKILTVIGNSNITLKESFIDKILKEMTFYEPFPKMNAVLALLRVLTETRCYLPQNIVEIIKKFYETGAKIKKNACLLFAYFADFVFKFDQKFYSEICQEYEKYQHDPFFPLPYRVFYQELKESYEKDWSIYLNHLHNVKGSHGLITELINDDIVSFRDNRKIDDNFIHCKIPANLFEPCHILSNRPNITMFCAAYSSIKIFSRMMQFANFFVVKDDKGKRTSYFTGVGGSESIYNLVSPNFTVSNDILIGALCFHQHKIAIKQLNRDKCDPNAPDVDGKYGIVSASAYNNVFGVLQLLMKNVNPLIHESFEKTALHSACENGCLEVLAVLIVLCPLLVNTKNTFGQTPLHIAIEHGRNDCAKKLIRSQNIDLNSKDDDGFSPLFYAINQKNIETVDLLLNDERCDINLQSNKGYTALHWSAKHGNDEITIKLLSRKDINTEIADNKGRKGIEMISSNLKERFINGEFQKKEENTMNNGPCRI